MHRQYHRVIKRRVATLFAKPFLTSVVSLNEFAPIPARFDLFHSNFQIHINAFPLVLNCPTSLGSQTSQITRIIPYGKDRQMLLSFIQIIPRIIENSLRVYLNYLYRQTSFLLLLNHHEVSSTVFKQIDFRFTTYFPAKEILLMDLLHDCNRWSRILI